MWCRYVCRGIIFALVATLVGSRCLTALAQPRDIDIPQVEYPPVEQVCAHPELAPKYDGFPRAEAIRLCTVFENRSLQSLKMLIMMSASIPWQRRYRCALFAQGRTGMPSYYEELANCLLGN